MTIVLYLVIGLLAVLGAHHLVKARRGLRTGVVEGLMAGHWGKRYSQSDEPDLFWINVRAGFLMAAAGGLAVLWLAITVLLAAMDRSGLSAAP